MRRASAGPWAPCLARNRLLRTGLAAAALLGAGVALPQVIEPAPPPATDAQLENAPTARDDDLEEIFVTGREPRYVERTRRDRIGRIWAPVYINSKGPFRLVLDTGASRSGIVPHVANDLGIDVDHGSNVILRGVTGSAQVATIKVQTIQVGDLVVNSARMPIMRDALGGADGILGTEGLLGRRVFIDFRNDLIHIARSHREPAPEGYLTIPFQLSHGRLLITDAQVGSIRAKAIIDTGGQVSVGNLALRNALALRRVSDATPQKILGVTLDVEEGESRAIPVISLGALEMRMSAMTFADVSIFKYWDMTSEPAVLIGMDVLGLLDTLIIDYERHELQLRMPEGVVRPGP